MLAVVGDASLGCPQLLHHVEAFLEDALVVIERNVERRVLAPVIAAADGEIDSAVAQEIERRPLFGNADRMM